jgi:4-hydroxy-3-methylbut-2-en-1-yl diphosphate reductase
MIRQDSAHPAGGGADVLSAAPRQKLAIVLASPRGFCAGVDRAIMIVEQAIERYGKPVYVRHEIVHNRTVVEQLETKGAVFVEELDEIPDGATVIFSAHGVPKSVPAEAKRRQLSYLDATCPLVSKVHAEAGNHFEVGRQIILIGHAGHPEVVGTMGQLPPGAVLLVEDVEQVDTLEPADPDNLAYITQTTLSVDDTVAIVDALRRRFPNIAGPRREDICYATTNRQSAVKAIAGQTDAILVVGAPNSSNSMRLVEVAKQAGCRRAKLVQHSGEIDWSMLDGVGRLGITAGASAPEGLVQEIIAECRRRFDVTVEEVTVTQENIRFNLPRALAG